MAMVVLEPRQSGIRGPVLPLMISINYKIVVIIKTFYIDVMKWYRTTHTHRSNVSSIALLLQCSYIRCEHSGETGQRAHTTFLCFLLLPVFRESIIIAQSKVQTNKTHHDQHCIDFLLHAKHCAKYFIFISTITGEETGARHG